MNRNLNEAIFDIAKVEAIMFAFENTYCATLSAHGFCSSDPYQKTKQILICRTTAKEKKPS